MEYKHRIADQMLAKKLASKGAILIEGPKIPTAFRRHSDIIPKDHHNKKIRQILHTPR